ncbi:MAG TPA: NTP transferase domain-containing protein [Candidatus Thermoplasmatota archaeon]|nr:NTP transferase domain-containing protein [Candidatus Thermoplasmatota archaeon]
MADDVTTKIAKASLRGLREPRGPVSGVVLAGGRGSRMGAFKPLLAWRGRTLLSYSLAALAPHCHEILIMAGPRAAEVSRQAEGARVLADPGDGPPVALRLAAQAARFDIVLVAPADAPFLRASTYAPLLAAGPDARFALDGVADPLVACYARKTLRAFRGRSLREIAARDVDAGALAGELRDVDEPGDLAG